MTPLGWQRWEYGRLKIPKLTLKREALLYYMKTPYKRQFTDKKNALYIQIFPISQKQMVSKKDSVVKATHFFFFCISLIRWKSESLKHLVNGRNGIGPGWQGGGVMGEIKMKWMWFSCWCGQQGSWWEMLQQTWPLYKGSVKNTVQVSKKQQQQTNKQKNHPKNQKQNSKQTATLSTCKQGKAFHRFKVQGK